MDVIGMGLELSSCMEQEWENMIGILLRRMNRSNVLWNEWDGIHGMG